MTRLFRNLIPGFGTTAVLLVVNPAVAAAILAPAAYAYHPALGVLCLAATFRQSSNMIPLFFGMIGILVYLKIGWKPKAALSLLAAGLAALCHNGNLAQKIAFRFQTWKDLISSFQDHPLLGHGFSLLSMPVVLAKTGSPLRSAHSDLLGLLFHGGVLAGLAALAVLYGVCFPLSQDQALRGIQSSLIVLGLLSLIRQTSPEPLVVSLVLGLVAWFIAELKQKENVPCGT